MKLLKKNIISICVRTAISLALISILLYIMKGNYAQIWQAIRGANLSFLLLGLATFALALVTASIRLKLIVEAHGKAQVTFGDAVSLTFIGYFFNNFLPTSIGGDVAKAYYLSRKNTEKLSSYTSVFIDRAIGLVTMIFMAAIALLLVQNTLIDKNVRCMIYYITACSIIAIFFIINKNFARKFSGLLALVKPIEEKAKRVYNALHNYKNHTSLIIRSLAISVVSQILFFAGIGILALSIGSRIPAIEILLRMPIISAMSLLPSINGLGVREGSTVLLFGPIIGKERAFALSILWLLVLLVMSVAGGLIYAISPQFKIKWGEIEEKEAI